MKCKYRREQLIKALANLCSKLLHLTPLFKTFIRVREGVCRLKIPKMAFARFGYAYAHTHVYVYKYMYTQKNMGHEDQEIFKNLSSKVGQHIFVQILILYLHAVMLDCRFSRLIDWVRIWFLSEAAQAWVLAWILAAAQGSSHRVWTVWACTLLTLIVRSQFLALTNTNANLDRNTNSTIARLPC